MTPERIAEIEKDFRERFDAKIDALEVLALCQAWRERDAALRKCGRLEAALRRYGRHDDGEFDNMGVCESHECGPDACTCGLDAAMKGE